jgi:hypothetical protein
MVHPFPDDCAARFRPVRELAAGGFGTVWLATQVALERPVVVKVLHEGVLGDNDAVQRFLSEAKVAAVLRHPNIVDLVDHGASDGVPWIAFEYVPGASLKDRVDKGPMPWRDACSAAMQIAAALEEAHGKAVLHRDVKPANVLQAGADTYKLADFGVARWQGSGVQTAAGIILGTPAYISPQQIKGLQPAVESDIYALGVTLFELLTGRLPVWDENLMLLFQRRLTMPVEPPSKFAPGIPPEVDALVLKALEPERETRFDSARALREALARLLGAAEPAAPRSRPSRTGRSQRITRSVSAVAAPGPAASRARPAVVAGVLAALTALVIGVVALRAPRPAPIRIDPAPVSPTPVAPGEPLRRAMDAALAYQGEVAIFVNKVNRAGGIQPAQKQDPRVITELQRFLRLGAERLRELSTAGLDSPAWFRMREDVAFLFVSVQSLRKARARDLMAKELEELAASVNSARGGPFTDICALELRGRAASARGDSGGAARDYLEAIRRLDHPDARPWSASVEGLLLRVQLGGELVTHELAAGGGEAKAFIDKAVSAGTRHAVRMTLSAAREVVRRKPHTAVTLEHELSRAALQVLKAATVSLRYAQPGSDDHRAALEGIRFPVELWPTDCRFTPGLRVDLGGKFNEIDKECVSQHLPLPPRPKPCPER